MIGEPTVAQMAPEPPTPANPVPAGPTGPAVTPTGHAGMQARVPMLVDLALKPLREAAKLIDPVSPEGQDLHRAMSLLAKRWGAPTADLSRAEVKLLGERAGSVSPAAPRAFEQAMRQRAAQQLGRPMSPAPAPAGVA